MEQTKIVFPKGDLITNDYFTGETWLAMLVPADSDYHCPIGNVTFAPGARNNWHRHPGGQILLVTDGQGYYQEEGQPARRIQAGDTVMIPPGVKHWHGAVPDRGMSHLAIGTNPEQGEVEWLEPVTDAEYDRQAG